jgi:type II secretory pathway component PulL
MANVEWAKEFFDSVTSRLPDLLTDAGEGHELEALDKLRAELGEKDKAKKAERKLALQAEMDQLEGKAPAPPTPAQAAAAAQPTPDQAAEAKPEANRKR